jgi:uncharacterized protein (DUF342 family)
MNIWELLLSASGGAVIYGLIRELVNAWVKIRKTSHELSTDSAETGRKAEKEKIDAEESQRLKDEERWNRYTAQLRKDIQTLKEEHLQLKKDCEERDRDNKQRIDNLVLQNGFAQIQLAKAEERISQYEEKLTENDIKFKPWVSLPKKE